MKKAYVSDTKAGKSISAYIVLDPERQWVATVRAHYSDAGVCLVNVFSDKDGFQCAKANGGGYDKFAACLCGMKIDGHVMRDHCAKTPETEALLAEYAQAMAGAARQPDWFHKPLQGHYELKAAKLGAHFANWNGERYASLHVDGGLDCLRTMGYTVIQAI